VLKDIDIRDAETFLTTYMSEQIPEASFEVGSASRDILIKGFAFLYAFLRGEIDRAKARQSLKRITEELTDADDISQAVDEILSNWFIVRKDGNFARALVRLHFTKRQAVRLPTTSVFWRTTALQYVVDTSESYYVISEQQLLPVYDSRGVLLDYVVDLPMRSMYVGAAYNLGPGTFVKTDIPGGLPFFSYAENVETFESGKNVETTTDLLNRADTAITVRNLINNRSCDAVLNERYPEVINTLTVGMGESEMCRDSLLPIYSHLDLHVGGCYDTYVDLPVVMVEENLTVGDYFYRPDGVVSLFRDPYLTYDLGRTFTSLGVLPGYVINIRGGIVSSPRGYIITKVYDHELVIQDKAPFTEAYDERINPESTLSYSIGWLGLGYAEIELTAGVYIREVAASVLPDSASVPVGTSRRIKQPGKVCLAGKPIQDIESVTITNPTGNLDAYKDVSTGFIFFSNRINTEPLIQVEPSLLEYQLTTLNPLVAQSNRAVNLLTVGFKSDPSIFDGLNLKISYRTLVSFSNISAYTSEHNVRVVSASHVVRGRNPVWLLINIPYKLKTTVTTVVDETLAAAAVATHINDFDPKDELDVSDISYFVRNAYPIIGSVYPFQICYYLNSPDGQQLQFSTTDLVSIFPTSTNGVILENGEDITPTPEMIKQGIVSIQSNSDLLTYLQQLGISDRTVSYRSTTNKITLERRG
jgi:hypothetical protein